MTRFVYVLPAGRFRWEVRAPKPDIEAAAEAIFWMDRERDSDSWAEADESERAIYWNEAATAIYVVLPASEPQFYRLKRDALIAARAIAIIIGGEVQPHDRRGRIQDPDSYGNDPRESHG